MWSHRPLVALLRRYGIKPYRYKRQRCTPVMARVPASFVDTTLWPQVERFDTELPTHLSEVTDRIVAQALNQTPADAEVVSAMPSLTAPEIEPTPPPPRQPQPPPTQPPQPKPPPKGGRRRPTRRKKKGRRR